MLPCAHTAWSATPKAEPASWFSCVLQPCEVGQCFILCLNLLYDTNIYSGEEATMWKNIRWVYAALSAAAWIDACRGGSRLSAQSLWRSSLCPSPHLPAQLFTHTQSGLGSSRSVQPHLPPQLERLLCGRSTTHCLLLPWLKHFCSLWLPVQRAAVPGLLPPTSQPSRRVWNITEVLTPGAPGSLHKANTSKKVTSF